MVTEKELSIKRVAYEIPKFSISSDLLGYRQCSLQYRYRTISKLAPSRPIQMWFGQFIHSVLEHSFKFYKSLKKLPSKQELNNICDDVKNKLASRGLYPRSKHLYNLAVRRVHITMEIICPDLFPMMKLAEKKLSGTETIDSNLIPTSLYEIVGVIDILSEEKVNLNKEVYNGNIIRDKIIKTLDKYDIKLDLNKDYEIIVDYKGMHRPSNNENGSKSHYSTWNDHKTQLNLYKLLREKQPDSNKVIAGIIIYINELIPTKTDLKKIKKDIEEGLTDIIPENKMDLQSIKNLNPDPISLDLRIARALRVEILKDESMNKALENFENVILQIQNRKREEQNSNKILNSWLPNNSPNDDTCTVCDHKTYCPKSTRKQIPIPPFEFNGSINSLKENIILAYFTPNANIHNRAKAIADEKVNIIDLNENRILAYVKDYKIIINMNDKKIIHNCGDFSYHQRYIKQFCKHLLKLFLFLKEYKMEESEFSSIINSIGNNINEWDFTIS
ncbi:MAG: PD-(D/E)XK nuclease family protein [Candidatus Lokiarchaeota archaeon]